MLDDLQELLGFRFSDPHLLESAMTHSSGAQEKEGNNERMEFFGDAILDLIVSEYLFHACPKYREGELTEGKASVVRRSTLAEVGRRIGLREYIHLGRGIVGTSKLPDSVYANVWEAIIAAVYLDGGFDAAKALVLRHFIPELEQATNISGIKNAKSVLQEWSQRTNNITPTYQALQETGPEHRKQFEVAVYIEGVEVGRGWGKNKKQAEQAAAECALREAGLLTDESVE